MVVTVATVLGSRGAAAVALARATVPALVREGVAGGHTAGKADAEQQDGRNRRAGHAHPRAPQEWRGLRLRVCDAGGGRRRVVLGPGVRGTGRLVLWFRSGL